MFHTYRENAIPSIYASDAIMGCFPQCWIFVCRFDAITFRDQDANLDMIPSVDFNLSDHEVVICLLALMLRGASCRLIVNPNRLI